MKLICQKCGSVYIDPGGNPETYICRSCGQVGLQRVREGDDRTTDPLVAGVAGAVLGASIGGGVGAVIGGLLGYWVGRSSGDPRP